MLESGLRNGRFFLTLFYTIIVFSYLSGNDARADSCTTWAMSPPKSDRRITEMYLRGLQARRTHDTAAALREFSAILSEPGCDSSLVEGALFNRAMLNYLSGDTAAAEPDFTALLSRYPKCRYSDRAAFATASLAFRMKNYSAAARHYSDIVGQRVGPPNSPLIPASILGWARCADRTNDCSTAERLCRDLIKCHPQSPEAEAARAYLESQDK